MHLTERRLVHHKRLLSSTNPDFFTNFCADFHAADETLHDYKLKQEVVECLHAHARLYVMYVENKQKQFKRSCRLHLLFALHM